MLVSVRKHMKELSMVRIIVAGLLLITVLIVCKRIWRQFFYSKSTKVLIPFIRKGKQIYILPTAEVARLQLIIPSESCHVGRFASDVFR